MTLKGTLDRPFGIIDTMNKFQGTASPIENVEKTGFS